MLGLSSMSFFFTASSCGVGEVVELAGIGLVVAENLRGHVDGGEFVPDGNFADVFLDPRGWTRSRGLVEGGGVVEQRIGAPNEGHAIDLIVLFDDGGVAELCGELWVGGDFREVEWSGESGFDDGSGDVAGRRDDVIVGGAAAAKLGDEFVAGAHVGCGDFAVMGLFEGGDEGRIGVAFPD